VPTAAAAATATALADGPTDALSVSFARELATVSLTFLSLNYLHVVSLSPSLALSPHPSRALSTNSVCISAKCFVCSAIHSFCLSSCILALSSASFNNNFNLLASSSRGDNEKNEVDVFGGSGGNVGFVGVGVVCGGVGVIGGFGAVGVVTGGLAAGGDAGNEDDKGYNNEDDDDDIIIIFWFGAGDKRGLGGCFTLGKIPS